MGIAEQSPELPPYLLEKINQNTKRLSEKFNKPFWWIYQQIKDQLYSSIRLDSAMRPHDLGKLIGLPSLPLNVSLVEDLLVRDMALFESQLRLKATIKSHSWSDLEIRVVSNTEIIARWEKGRWQRHTMSQLDLNDKRRGDMPSDLWNALVYFATETGSLTWENANDPKLQKKVQRLAKKLSMFFKIKESPFFPYGRRDGYRCRFIISDNRPNQ